MNKKYFFTTVTAISLLLALESCKKYLDQQPIAEVTTPAVFKDVNGAYQALVGAYTDVYKRQM